MRPPSQKLTLLSLIFMMIYAIMGLSSCTHFTPEETPKVTPVNHPYWISSTKKTHNYTCRYYRIGKGKLRKKGSGNNCKICGGDFSSSF